VWLTEIKEAGGNMTINGLAVDNQAVADFMSGLGVSKHFKNVELVESTQGVGPTAGFKRFAVKAGVLYQAAEPPPSAQKAKASPVAKKEEKKG
jgi:Tfp pilus assembly protein PilN